MKNGDVDVDVDVGGQRSKYSAKKGVDVCKKKGGGTDTTNRPSTGAERS